MSWSMQHFRNEIRVVERTGRISEDKQSLIVDVSLEKDSDYLPRNLLSGRSLQKVKYQFPLMHPPESADKFILEVMVEKLPFERILATRPMNLKYVREGNRLRKETVDDSFLLKYYYSVLPYQKVGEQQIRYQTGVDSVEDMPECYKPFIIRIQPSSKGLFYWDDVLVIPYKQEGNRFYVYVAGEDWKARRVLCCQHLGTYYEANVSTWLCRAVIVPPAFVIDVVTFPLQALGAAVLLASGSPYP